MKTKVVILVRNELKGLYISIGKQLANKYSVHFVADNPAVASLISGYIDESDITITTLPEPRFLPHVSENTLSIAKAVEKKYGITLSLLLSEDRNLGRGYLTNIDKYVNSPRMWWTHEQRLQHLVREIELYEPILKNCDVLISQFPEAIPSIVCKYQGIHYFKLLPLKFGDRCFWSDDDFYGNSHYRKALEQAVSCGLVKMPNETPEYELDAGGDKVNREVKYDYRSAIADSIGIFLRDTLNGIRFRRKPNSVHIYGWIPSRFTKVHNYRYVKKYGVTPDELKAYRIVYFPLQMEPEASLLKFSKEFTNTQEAIVWISKSLPVDWILVVKEQSKAFQFRSRSFYHRFRQIGNVVLASPEAHSWEWIKASKLVSTITGTAAQEAIHFNTPVLSFSRHVTFNKLPTVFPVSNFEEVKEAIDVVCSGAIDEEELAKSRIALATSQVAISFDLPMLKHCYKSNSLEKEGASIACRELVTQYPELFKVD